MKRIFLLWGVAMTFIACQREGEVLSTTPTPKPTPEGVQQATQNNPNLKWVALTQDYNVSEEEAKNLVLSFVRETQKVNSTARAVSLEIESIEAVKASNTTMRISQNTSMENDLYIVNFKDNNGFVLTAADKRVPGIFAYSDRGKWEKSLTNPVQKILYERLLNYIEQSRIIFDKRKDKLVKEAWEEFTKDFSVKEKENLYKEYFDDKGNLKRVVKRASYQRYHEFDPDNPNDPNCPQGTDYEVFYNNWELVEETEVLLKTGWAQFGDYNLFTRYRNCSSGQTPVGCVAVAVGQIMAYYKRPAIFNGRIMHWDQMTTNPIITSLSPQGKEDVQHLLADLGESTYLKMNYKCGSSGAFDENACETFKKLGYIHATLSDRYDIEKDLLAKRPVYIGGFDKTKENRPRIGHAWVIDGYRKYKATSKEVIYIDCMEKIYHDTMYFPLIHHNLGWGMGSNLWYSPKPYYENEKESFGNYPQMDRYPYDISIINNIY